VISAISKNAPSCKTKYNAWRLLSFSIMLAAFAGCSQNSGSTNSPLPPIDVSSSRQQTLANESGHAARPEDLSANPCDATSDTVCVVVYLDGGSGGTSTGSTGSGPSAGGGQVARNPPASYPDKIYNAALSYYKTNTRGLMGAIKFNECVAAVQQVLINAGLSVVGNGTLVVHDFKVAAESQGYSETTTPVKGDIVDLSDDHLGICITDGCSQMLSNASTPGTFSWEDTPSVQNAVSTKADNDPIGPITYLHHN